MSHVLYTQYKHHKQAMKVRWSECKVQLKQKDNNCSCLCVIHLEPEDVSRIYFGITFTVIVVMLLAITIVTAAIVVAFICKRFVPLTLVSYVHIPYGQILAGNLFWQISDFESTLPIFHSPKT